MSLKFVTGNKNKFEEVKAILAPIEVEQVVLDLEEIQDLDPQKVIEHKLKQVMFEAPGEYMVEDTSLYMDCLNGKLPGPFIKFFESSLGNQGLADMAEKMGNTKGTAKTIIGHIRSNGDIQFFEGEVRCDIVQPRGNGDFGFGPIFQVEGQDKTYAEMTKEEKHTVSMRGKAVRKLKEFLITQ
jgi:inosine triphosphate pyrophosphatase